MSKLLKKSEVHGHLCQSFDIYGLLSGLLVSSAFSNHEILAHVFVCKIFCPHRTETGIRETGKRCLKREPVKRGIDLARNLVMQNQRNAKECTNVCQIISHKIRGSAQTPEGVC